MGCIHVKPNSIANSKNDERAKRLQTFRVTHQDFVKEKNWSITDDYTFESVIGKGGYGEVRKAVHKKSGFTRAVKVIAKTDTDKERIEKIMNEVNILRSIDHANMMKIIEFYQDDTKLYIVSEYYDGGELFEKISHLKNFSEKQAAGIMQQILSAVNYLHKHKIVHRDLKPENIVYESRGDNSQIKVIDFGTSQTVLDDETLSKAFGTAYYVAPEVLKKQYNSKCDVWSCGVILYILLCGHPPFNGSTEKKILEKVLKGLYEFKEHEWKSISEEAVDLIKKMLVYEPAKRLTASEALGHPWFQNMLGSNQPDKPSALNTLNNLKTFRAERKLQQAIWIFLATYFSNKEEKTKMIEVFQSLDKDKDGILTPDEIREGYELITGKVQDAKAIEEMIKKIDMNGSGTIDYTEFVTATINRNTLLSTEKLEGAFNLFDKDGNGYLTIDELKEFFTPSQKVEEAAWNDVISEVDMNKDGQISMVEFKEMMLKMLK
jgi:calcium-dependent protein kinase